MKKRISQQGRGVRLGGDIRIGCCGAASESNITCLAISKYLHSNS